MISLRMIRRYALGLATVLAIAAENGPAAADFEDGVRALQRGDIEAAIREWRPLAEAGEARAQFAIGALYRDGNGLLRDAERAVEWYRRAAEQGFVPAQYNLGVMRQKGEGVVRDHAAAAEWYRREAEQGHARAQFNLGATYNLGVGVERDLPRAHQWMTLAAARDDRNAFDYRTRLEGCMTEGEIAEEKRLVREFLAVEREL